MSIISHEEEIALFDALNDIPALGWSERLAFYRAAQQIPGAWSATQGIDLGRDGSGQIVTLGAMTAHRSPAGITEALRKAAALTGSDLTRRHQPKSDH